MSVLENGDRPTPVLVSWLALAALTAVLALVTYTWRHGVLDDAYIAFRYAWNLARGNGLVFNPGERVEGFTSPLWTLIVAAGLWLDLPPEPLSQGIGVCCNALLLIVTYRFGREQLGHRPAVALIAPMLLAANLNLGAWAAHGLETCLFTLLVTVGIRRLTPSAERPISGALALAAAVWTRPEGILFFAALAGLRSVRSVITSRRWGPSRLELRVWAAFAAPVALLFLVRFLYYGEWLPNTFYAKATGGAGRMASGGAYLVSFLEASWLYGLALLPVVSILPGIHKGARPWLAVPTALTLVYVVWIGGDAFAGARFMTPILAPAYLLVQDGLARMLESRGMARASALAFVLLVGLATVFATHPALSSQIELATSMTRNRVYLGRLLREITPADTFLALNTVGALPYYAQRPAIDLYGLTDAHIARAPVRARPGGGTGHEKGDGAYVLSRRPGLILLRNVWLADIPIEAHRSLHGTSEREIVRDPRFERDYVPINLHLRSDLLFGFYAHVSIDREDLLAKFASIDLEALGDVGRLTSERGQDKWFYQQGIRLARQGHLEQARLAYTRSLALCPGASEVHLALGQVLRQLGALEAAVEHFQRAAALSSDDVAPQIALGGILAGLERPEAALAAFGEAERLAPGRADIKADIATLQLKLNRYLEAASTLKAYLKLEPEDVEMWTRLGVAAGMSEDWASAQRARDRANQLAPNARAVNALTRWLEVRRAEAAGAATP